jgi:citrate lyase subunit beta/citryl-CoA lyase
MNAVESGKTFLFVRADRPERFGKAFASDADGVIIDLEDAVAPVRKPAGREAIAALGHKLPADLMVRINPPGTAAAADDVDLLRSITGLAAVMVAKAEEPVALNALSQVLGATQTVALVETAEGLANVRDIAQSRSVVRLAFGHLDYALDLGIEPKGAMMTHARCEIVVAARAAGLPPPIDGVTTELDDLDVIGNDARAGAELGFGAKLCIHPKQLAAVAEAFRPSPAEIAWQERRRYL